MLAILTSTRQFNGISVFTSDDSVHGRYNILESDIGRYAIMIKYMRDLRLHRCHGVFRTLQTNKGMCIGIIIGLCVTYEYVVGIINRHTSRYRVFVYGEYVSILVFCILKRRPNYLHLPRTN